MAFKTLADEGKSPAEIAVRFGTTELNVKRRMALARVSPVLFDLFRNGAMSYDELAAFTITDDHERQEQVWNSLASYNRYAHTIKRMLASEEIPASDKRIRFIGGLDAIEAAGGTVRRDLFDGESGGYATDSGLVEKLVLEKLEAEAEGVRAEGWKWVEVHASEPDGIYNHADSGLELLDLRRQGGLGNAAMLGRLAEMQVLSHGRQIFEIAKGKAGKRNAHHAAPAIGKAYRIDRFNLFPFVEEKYQV